MESTSPSMVTAPLQRSRLLSSITRLKDVIRNVEIEADKIETDMAYKEAQIEDLKSDRIAHDGPTTTFDKAIKHIQTEREQIHDSLDAKKEEIVVLKDKMKRKEARLAIIPPVESADAPRPEDDEEVAALLEITNTQMSQVFTLSDDGKTYIDPAMLRGVPVEPIDEDDDYWEATWIKFTDAIDEDRVQREYQQEIQAWHQRAREGTLLADEEDLEKAFKRYRRNLNQARVIRKWFLPGITVHPNQIMSKHHLPNTGLCIAHVLYKICNILDRLNALRERGELGMSPLHFLMWRMSVSLDRHQRTHMKTFWRLIIDEDHLAYDEVLRKAGIRGAQHVGDSNFYNRKQNKTASTKGQAQQTAAASSGLKESDQDPEQPTTPSRKSRGPHHQSMPVSFATPIVDLTGPLKTASSTKESPTFRGLQHQHKRRRSSAAVGQQVADNDGGTPPAKKTRKAAWAGMQLALRPKSSTESMASDRSEIAPSARKTDKTEIETRAQVSREKKNTSTAVNKLPRNDNLGGATQRDAEAWSKYAEEIARKYRVREPETTLDDATSYFRPVGEDDDVSVTKRDAEHRSVVENARATVGESPFPKTGKKVSHGFIFPWYCCDEARDADERW